MIARGDQRTISDNNGLLCTTTLHPPHRRQLGSGEVGCQKKKHLIFDPTRTFRIFRILDLEKSQGMKGISEPIRTRTSNISNISNIFRYQFNCIKKFGLSYRIQDFNNSISVLGLHQLWINTKFKVFVYKSWLW